MANGIRGVMVPSRIVMWVTWQWNTWRDGAITYCDVGDMVMQYVAYRYLATRGGTLTWHIGTWPVDTWPSIGGTYHHPPLVEEPSAAR